MSKVGRFLSNIWQERQLNQSMNESAGLKDINAAYAGLEPYSLGTYETEGLKRRDRKSIYTAYKVMMQDPTIHAALNLLVAAALGGHESRGEIVFINPSDEVTGEGKRANELRNMVMKEAPYLQSLLNKNVFTLCRNAIGHGDGYMRVYPKSGVGISHVICNEQLDPPLIQAYERAGRTVGFHVLEINNMEIRKISELSTHQILRMKMQRTQPLPQFRMDNILTPQLLQEDDLDKVGVIPSPVGGSFLQAVEEPWTSWALNFTALNTQQIADSVNHQLLTLDMSGMPEDSRRVYKKGLQETIQKQQEKTRKALQGGKEIYETHYTLFPVYGEKQLLSPLGNFTQRTAPMSLDLVMTHLKRGIGALGLDLSLVGWMELISGGLGDGGAFHTSAQVATLSVLIRQALTETLNQFCIMHFAYKYGVIYDEKNLPFKIEFYSDISAAATEALNNKNTRANTATLTASAIQIIKDLGMCKDANMYFLDELMGIDQIKAQTIADSIDKAQKKAEAAQREEAGGVPAHHGQQEGENNDDEGI
ncbi:hypothetical protein [Acinetobacter sp. ANC 3813]|uniref:hypothetical protein n=1 Tax=Acinetobacter sp. ANC 3813 TaxID=1977873 RepID=UPI000B68A7C2|nr:hypothetical protein [Acinetobacter sp. ANC 3813]OTG87874.1 hypothetical protein B9T34_16185 [Acinetobacter sp. ANC 3813]